MAALSFPRRPGIRASCGCRRRTAGLRLPAGAIPV